MILHDRTLSGQLSKGWFSVAPRVLRALGISVVSRFAAFRIFWRICISKSKQSYQHMLSETDSTKGQKMNIMPWHFGIKAKLKNIKPGISSPHALSLCSDSIDRFAFCCQAQTNHQLNRSHQVLLRT